jgi:hypothetical protein
MRSSTVALGDPSIGYSAWAFDVSFYLSLSFEPSTVSLRRRSAVSTIPQLTSYSDELTAYSDELVEVDHEYRGVQGGRYWGIRATPERIDGRRVREEYYESLARDTVFPNPRNE